MVDIEEELTKQAAYEIAAEIDFEIIAGMLVTMGWTKIETQLSLYPPDDAYEIRKWVNDNVLGHYKCRGNIWLFEKEKDALLFSLKHA